MKTLLLIILLVVILFIIFSQNYEIARREEYKKLIDDVKTFSYFVGNCSITKENADTIKEQIKYFNGRDEMDISKEYSDLIWGINQLYIKRFIQGLK